MTQRLTLLMLSAMGAGDGGRETWLANFLDEVVRQSRDVSFDVVHQEASGPTLLEAGLRPSVVRSVQCIRLRWMWCPASVEFLVRLAIEGKRVPRGAPLLAVGGLAEAVGALLVSPFRGKQGRVMWLRSIYTREKAAQLPSITKNIVVAIERIVLGRFGLVLANGEDTAAFYRSMGAQCNVIANAVPLDVWAMPSPRAVGTLRIAFIGRLAEVKGIRQFLRAVQLCEQDARGLCRFDVVGDGPARPEVEALVTRTALMYHGQVANAAVRSIVADCDVCVALTVSGPLLGGGGVSNALVEQMAAGRIIVAWDNDIFRQVLDSSVAYLVPQDDARMLSDTLLHIARNRDEALGRAAAACRRSREYSMSGHVDSFFRLLERSAGDAS